LWKYFQIKDFLRACQARSWSFKPRAGLPAKNFPSKTTSQVGISMASQSLSARLQAQADTYKNTLTLIQRLQELPSTPGTSSNSDSDPRLELSSEIHQSLKEQEDELETLRQEVDDDATTNFSGGYVGGGSVRRRNSEQVRERERVAALVARLGEDLKMYDDITTLFLCR